MRPSRSVSLAAFDLDGTLLRGNTVCEAIALRIGRAERMKELERLSDRADVHAAREEMVEWYRSVPASFLYEALESLELAPGATEGFRLLKEHRIKTAIVSITWEFAVEWFARRLGAEFYVGTRYLDDHIAHFWPEDKPHWLMDLATQLGVAPSNVAAVGDSPSDLAMLRAVGYPVFVGHTRPDSFVELLHFPDGDIRDIAQRIIGI
jgi:HAD superfamily phosphoserine phosphatase-like hydrolase